MKIGLGSKSVGAASPGFSLVPTDPLFDLCYLLTTKTYFSPQHIRKKTLALPSHFKKWVFTVGVRHFGMQILTWTSI